jgi:hypothetical protein
MKKLVSNLALLIMLTAVTVSLGQDKRSLNNYREPSKDGVNVFESPKDTAVIREFDGVSVRLGGASALQFQMLDHENGWMDAGGNEDSPWFEVDPLTEIGDNFNLATANMDFDVQLHDGLRMHLRTYLSARHHNEAWIKGGYIQIDNLNWISEGTLSELMKYVTVKVGHMENNYGDMHFRRSDNANALYNPFVGNAIMDGFTTEVGAEVYYRNNGWIGMLGFTNGKLNQKVTDPKATSPSFLAKLGYDKQINEDLRFRLTGSLYNSAHTSRSYLYSADRAGSRYYLVMDNTGNPTSNFKTGRFDPGFKNQITAIMINPFVKYGGLEFFGMYETASGYDKVADNEESRTWTQLMAELLYRFGNNENFYIGGRYNTVSGELVGSKDKVSIDRISIGAGVFFTKNVLAKLEYVTQQYNDFAVGDVYNEGKFNGLVFEAVIQF